MYFSIKLAHPLYGFDPKSTGITKCIFQLEQPDQQTAQTQIQHRELKALAQNLQKELESRFGLAEAQGWLAPSTTVSFGESAQLAAAAYNACMAGLPGRVLDFV